VNELPFLQAESFKQLPTSESAADFSNANRAAFMLSKLFESLELCSVGYSAHFQVALWLFNHAIRPTLGAIDSWLHEARLDPTSEGFITADFQVSVFSEAFWTSKYRLVRLILFKYI
jgi:hypothetical protein